MMEQLRVPPQRVKPGSLTTRLDCSFYNPDAMRVDQLLKQYGNLKRLSEIVDPTRKITNGVRGPDLQPSSYCLVRLQDCENWSINFDECLTISEEQFQENRRCQLFEGDIVVAVGGYIGNASIVRNVKLAVIGQHSAVLPRKPDGSVDEGYFVAYLNSKIGTVQFQRYVSGTVQPGINLEDLPGISIPIPNKTIQTYIGDKVRQAERLRERSRELEKYFQLAIQDEYPEIFGVIQENGNHSWATLEDLSGSLNPGAYNPERLRIRRYLKGHGGKQIQNIATIETPASSIYHPNDIYIGLDAISSNSSMITSSTVKDSEVEGNSRVLLEGPVISKLRPYLNKVTYIPPELAGALGSTELLCVQPKNSISGWFLYGVLKLESTIRQLNPASTGSTHPRISREDVLDLIVPWHEDSFLLGEKLRIAQEGYFAAEQLTTAAKLLVEALIEGKITELDLQEAQEALQRGDTTLDRQIHSRLTRKGIPARGERTEEPPLFPDLDALYRVLSNDDTDEDSDWDSTPESRQRWQTPIQSSRRAAEASTPYSQDATVTLLDEEGD